MRTTLRFLAVAGLALAACSSDPTTTPATESTGVTTSVSVPDTTPATEVTTPDTTVPGTDTVPPTDAVQAIAYLVQDEHLVAVRREVRDWEGDTLMAALLAGPTAAEAADGVMTIIPAGTVLHGVTVDGDTAVVDLSAQFESGGGSLSMMLRMAQVVYTVTQVPNVDVVRIAIDGELREILSGEGLMVDHPTRDQYQSVLPAIFLEAPLDGDPWVEPMTIAGETNAFEATVNYQVLAADGTVLLEGVTTATCGTGCWGVFMQELAPLPAGASLPVTLRVFDYSEADGTTMLDVVEVTLT